MKTMAQNQEQEQEQEQAQANNPNPNNSQMPAEVLQALANAGQSKFIKFADGQTMKLHFYPELTTTMQTTFNGKRDKPTTRFKFTVTEHDNADDIPLEYQSPKEWDTGSEVAKELKDYFNEGKVDLQITRKGLEMGTKYRIVPIQIQ
jgi:hypothetical protein